MYTNSRRRGLSINQLSVTIPASAMPTTNYLQVSVLMMNFPAYSIVPANSEGKIKTPMVRVNLEENDNTIAHIGEKVYNKRLAVSNLTDPILLKIPYSEAIGEKNTISCGFTAVSGDQVSLDGISTQVLENEVICSTNHLTDFVLEEHLDEFKNRIRPTIVGETINRMNVYKSFAFWMTLLLLMTLPVWLYFGYKKDQREQLEYSTDELEYKRIHVYTSVFTNLKKRTSWADSLEINQSLSRPPTGLDSEKLSTVKNIEKSFTTTQGEIRASSSNAKVMLSSQNLFIPKVGEK